MFKRTHFSALLLLIFIVLHRTETVLAQNLIHSKGNEIEMSAPANDSFLITDPASGRQWLKVLVPKPIKLNREPLYPCKLLSSPLRYKGPEASYHTFLFNQLKKELDKLADGIYFFNISILIFNKEGQLVYYSYNGLHKASTFNNKPALNNVGFNDNGTQSEIIIDTEGETTNPDLLIDKIDNKIIKLLNKVPQMHAGQLNNNVVSCYCSMFNAQNVIQVKDHVATFWANADAL